MSITITLTEKEILERPNDMDLGKYIRGKFNHEKFVDEYSYDKCVICGEESPYTKNTPIRERIGYVDGAGQSCFKLNTCEK
jgi:hypothetical protein